jgi:hypothetical protein
MSRERPVMPERIAQLAVAVSPKHICERLLDFGAGFDGGIKDGVDIIDVQKNAGGGAAQGLRGTAFATWRLVAQHQNRIADFDLGVPNFSIRDIHAKDFGRAEGPFIEIDGARRIGKGEIGSHCMVAGRNRLHLTSHKFTSWDSSRPYHRFGLRIRLRRLRASIKSGSSMRRSKTV